MIDSVCPSVCLSVRHSPVAYHVICGSIFIQICAVGSKTRIFSATECGLAVQGHPRSMILVYDFLLIRHCDYGPTLYRV